MLAILHQSTVYGIFKQSYDQVSHQNLIEICDYDEISDFYRRTEGIVSCVFLNHMDVIL